MKSVDLLIADRTLCLRGRLATEWAGAVVGALSADPVTWEELQFAVGRFVVAADWSCDLPLKPVAFPDANADRKMSPGGTLAASTPDCVIDLPGRVLLARWDQADEPLAVSILGRGGCEPEPIRYHLDSDWLVSSDFESWPARVEQRRRERLSRWSLDPRTVLYGSPMLTFLAQRSERLHRIMAPTAGQADRHASVAQRESLLWRTACQIYRDWLDQRPAAFDGRSVRTVLHQDMEHLCSDLEDRESQWARTGQPPRGLRETDTAYRCAGIGPHESVLYEELVMFLLGTCTNQTEFSRDQRGAVAKEVERLRDRRDQWMGGVDEEGLMGKSPREVIDSERRRIPLVVDDSHDAFHDDCPLCQMMLADERRPVFWRLDGYAAGLDASLALDLAWELDDDDDDDEDDDDEEGDDEEGDQDGGGDEGDTAGNDWAATGNRERPLADAPAPKRADRASAAAYETAGTPRADSIWKRVCMMTEPGEWSPDVDLFTVAACTGELIQDLKERAADRSLIDPLNRHVGNLHSALRSGDFDLLGPVVARFCECLGEIETHYDELIAKVDDLQSRLVGLAQAAED